MRALFTVMLSIGLVAGLALTRPATTHAQVPPNARWQTLVTENFRVTFAPGLETLAAHTAERAEATHSRLAEELGHAPRGPIDVLLTDYVDQSNGFATPFPSNRITLYAKPPTDGLTLAHFDDWVELLIAHELTHTFHLDRAGPLGRGLRTIFGRVPVSWPFFPTIGIPNWSVEGLATFIESDHTGKGRVNGSHYAMILRTAALRDDLATIDQVSGSGPRWPGPSRPYIYGSIFAEHLARNHGPRAIRSLIHATANAWIPPPLAFDRTARSALGESYTELYTEWTKTTRARATTLADSIRSIGAITESERLPGGGYEVRHPRVAPDGRVVYTAFDGRSAPATRIVEPGTGAVQRLARRNSLGPVSWMPDGSIVTAQLESDGPYRTVSDLYRIEPDGTETRLTTGARLGEPDATTGGDRIVAVRYEGGTNHLVIYRPRTGQTRTLIHPQPDVHWALPRWSPDGRWIAAGRWEDGEYEIAVLDTNGTIVHRMTASGDVENAPTWSPDGRYVLFHSDRGGITNLYAATGPTTATKATSSPDETNELPRLQQVTRVLTGAFYPEVSPDGEWIYFVKYDADGFHIERIPYNPALWNDPGPAPTDTLRRLAQTTLHDSTPATDTLEIHEYSPLPTLRPRYWTPTMTTLAGGISRFYGVATGGHDLVDRHAFHLAASIEPRDRITEGHAAYTYAGLGNPTLTVEATREWEHLSLSTTPDDAPNARLMTREDGITTMATFTRQRWRSSTALSLGAEHITERPKLFDAPGYQPSYPGSTLLGPVLRLGYANYQEHPYSISREDGISFQLIGRARRDLEPYEAEDGTEIDRSRTELSTQITAYKSIPIKGFARHVIAVRLSGLERDGPGATATTVGGTIGDGGEVAAALGRSTRLMPVRGFSPDTRYGTRAWSASLEYRAPIALIDRGYDLWPLYLDRLSGAAFLDAGNAWCTDAQKNAGIACPDPRPATLLSAGTEISLDLLLLHSAPLRVRVGLAKPLTGDPQQTNRITTYIELGQTF